ncbi:MAG: T9SS type A sorting domain-containing protein [Bacteroidetes bacterium]|nr:T9SS type A sorting domain-containing protein [Bacteroidota bacterium]
MNPFFRNSFFAAVFTLCVLQLQAQAPFVQAYSAFPANQDQIEPSAMTQCANSDLLLAWTENPGFLISSFGVITRTASNGSVLWSSKLDDFDTTTNITIRTIGENSDGSIWVFGQFEEFSSLFYKNYFVAELSAAGTLNWSKFYEVTNTYLVGNPGCHKMYDGGYMLRLSFDTHVQLLRTNANGTLRWGKLYSTDTTGAKFRGRGVALPDSNYVIIGKSGDFLSYIKIDTAGNVLTSYRMQGWWNPGDGVLGGISLLQDNSIMVSGRSDNDPYLMKFDPQGNVVWIKTYTSTTINTDVLFYLMPASNGTVYGAGTRNSPVNISALGQLFQFDTSGNVLQAAACIDNTIVPSSYSLPMLGNADEIFVLENGTAQGAATRLYKIGSVLGAACNMQDITTTITTHTPLPPQPVIYTRSDGWTVGRDFSFTPFALIATLQCNATGVNESSVNEAMTLFPNPVQSGGVVTFTAAGTTAWQLTDAAGRTVLNDQTTGGTVQISLSQLSSGVYVFTAHNENGQLQNRQKLIVTQ